MKKMFLAHREIHDKDIICAILSGTNVMTISMIDGDKPYAVPVNYGFHYGEETLDFYFHTGLEGTKLELLPQNETVCVTMYLYKEFPERQQPMDMHTYASVMAFGKYSILDMEKDREEYGKAFKAMMVNSSLKRVLKCTKRKFSDMYMCKISCKLEDVYGKSEHEIKSAEDVAECFGKQ